MNLFYGFAVYFVIWWITLFLVLPYGIRSQAESDEEVLLGTDPGAPVKTGIWLKMAVNTILAGIVFGVWYVVTVKFGFSMDTLAGLLFDLDAKQ